MTTTATSSADSTPGRLSRAALLAHAQASPAAVLAKDKRAWLALFADGGAVHDPVGTPACAKGAFTIGRANGPDDLARFYDCFIAPNTVRFEVHRDMVAGRSVVRDVTLITTGLSGLPTAVPAHLVYTMADGPGPVRIARVEAYWQSADVMRTVRGAGARGVLATAISIWQLLRSFGVKGTRAYLRGVQDRPRSAVAREAVRAWVDALSTGDGARVSTLSAPSCEVELPGGERASIARALSGELRGWKVEADKILVSGWSASCTLRMRAGDRERYGVAILELARAQVQAVQAAPAGTIQIRSARLYWDLESERA